MKDGSINKFVIKTFLATIPLVALLLLYIIVDPFAVVRSHKPCPAFGSVYPFNKGYISTCAYIENREARNYNAFILGSSRTIFFRATDWSKHIGADARIFHFDASNETPEGIYLKLKFIDEHGDSIKYAVIEMPGIFFSDRNEYISYRVPWQLDGYIYAPDFHYYYFNRFLDWSMFKCIFNHKFTGKIPEGEDTKKVVFMNTVIDGYDTTTNETYFNARDSLYAHNPEKGLSPIYNPILFHYTECIATETHYSFLRKIRSIFDKHRTDYKVILGPMGDYSILREEEKQVIMSIFGKEKVCDLSTFPAAYDGTMTFYDNLHFTPTIGKKMLETAYSSK